MKTTDEGYSAAAGQHSDVVGGCGPRAALMEQVSIEQLRQVADMLLASDFTVASRHAAQVVADACKVSTATVYRVRRGDKSRYLPEKTNHALAVKYPAVRPITLTRHQNTEHIDKIANAILRSGRRKQGKIMSRYHIGYRALVAIRHGANPQMSAEMREKMIAKFGPMPESMMNGYVKPSAQTDNAVKIHYMKPRAPAPEAAASSLQRTLFDARVAPPALPPNASHMMDALVMLAEVCVRMYGADEEFMRRFLRTAAQVELPILQAGPAPLRC